MIYLIIAGCIIIAALFAIIYFFSVAFVRHNSNDIDNIDAKINDFLSEYKEVIIKGLQFINSQPHEWVSCKSFDGLKLCARYYDCNSDKTVILFHGYRSSAARDFSCAVEMYYKMGFNVLLVDQRSHGKSQGKLITFGVKERRDVKTWVDFANDTYGSNKKILLGGMSMGATTVLLSSELDLPANVKGIVADCGFTSPIAIIKKVANQKFKISGSVVIPLLNILCLFFGNFSLYGASTTEALKKSHIPVLLIHGKNDNFVPCEMSKQAFEYAACEKQIFLVDKADHGFSFLLDTPGVTETIKKFTDCHF